MNKIILFGAGKIGRSFIGQLFSQGGYEVVFVDIYKPVIDALNERGNYNVIIKSNIDSVLNIKNVRGVLVSDHEAVTDEIASAHLVGVSIGQNGLPNIMPLLAKGLLKRFEHFPKLPLDIIIAENLRNAAEYFESELQRLLPESYPLKQLVGLVETSIGKMVPIMQKKDVEEDVLQVFAEPYNTLILDKKAFKNHIPDIKGLSPKENMKAWVDRKLFIHNLGHAAAAYIGHLHNPRFIYLYEALNVPTVYIAVKEIMQQSANVLIKKYPSEFTTETMTDHINDLLSRFTNKALGDTIYRVGCDLNRKLGPDDRLAGAINMAIDLNLPYNKILYALVFACHFRATNEEGKMLTSDIEFANSYKKGIQFILKNICKFDENKDSKLFSKASEIDSELKKPQA